MLGGGTGHVLKLSVDYLKGKFSGVIRKYVCELTPKFIEMQKRTNPDIEKILNENICNTSLGDKEVDIALLVDVLEHVDDHMVALRELQRISRYVILTVPLEGNVVLKAFNLFTRNRQRRWALETLGHVQVFHSIGVRRDIESVCGEVVRQEFVNTFEYNARPSRASAKSAFARAVNRIALMVHKVSPLLCSYLFFDSVTFLVRCKEH